MRNHDDNGTGSLVIAVAPPDTAGSGSLYAAD
jgi:hypothetical protein